MRRFAPWIAVLALAACAHGPASPNFTLTDDRGTAWTLADQRGRVVLLTFGFTHCADTCPLTTAKLVRIVNGLGARGDDVRVAFVTVDPQRDTPPVLHRWISKFGGGDRLVGLTGTPAQISAVERDYHVWAQRVPGKRPHGDYDVAHSAAIYFIDRSGAQRSVRDDDDSQAALSQALRELL